MIYDITIDGKNYRLELDRVEAAGNAVWTGARSKIDAVLARRDVLSIIDRRAKRTRSSASAPPPTCICGWERPLRGCKCAIRDRCAAARAPTTAKGPRKLLAPMPGKVVRVLIEGRVEVEAGQGVLVVEAMKMQNEIKSPKKGVVRKMVAAEGANVNAGDVLAVVE